MRVGLMYIDIARNMIWDEARKRQTEALLCLDDDMTFTPQTFEACGTRPATSCRVSTSSAASRRRRRACTSACPTATTRR
jgi:hypothetical protein